MGVFVTDQTPHPHYNLIYVRLLTIDLLVAEVERLAWAVGQEAEREECRT
jgi:hypothetical protein